jgi:GNAT superfamily N-acetyltransferase
MHHLLPDLDFLPGHFTMNRGTFADYKRLAAFHYKRGHPQFPVQLVTIRHEWDDRTAVAAVGVLCYPALRSFGREAYFGDVAQQPDWVNANLRTVRRVLVHPQYRGIGLAGAIIRRLVADCPTPHIEALAAMGDVVPMFQRCGFRSVEAAGTPYYVRRTGLRLAESQLPAEPDAC